jgi:Protein of unknown function (DUF2742)
MTEELQLPEITPLARRLFSRVPSGTPCPRYGSPEWNALPDQDPRRAAAILRSAEAWRRHCSPAQVAQDLADEMAAQAYIADRLLVETSHDVAQAADWPAIFARPTHAELVARRRGEAA